MADPRSRHSAGRRSPTFNPARASMPVNIGYNLPYTGELHAVPTARYDAYDASAPRRHDPKTASGGSNPVQTTITTYNVTKDPGVSRSLSRSNRNRSSTIDAHAGKPIIVTTNHPRPHVTTGHASSSARDKSPPREPYRPNDDAYYALQPASSIRSRSQHRHSYSYNQGAPLSDEFYRLRERVGGAGEDRFWAAPVRASTDNFRNPRPHPIYATPAHSAHTATPAHHAPPVYVNSSAVADYDDDYYEYTKPSDLARYDLDHDRDRKNRRDSFDRPYYRPHVNVISSDSSRYEPRNNRGKPPASAGLDRYNRAAASGVYDRPSVTLPAPPAVPPPPPLDTTRRPAQLEGPRSPTIEQRTGRPRPVSLYQDGPTRPSHADDIYRSRDDERVPRSRRERDDGYRDDDVPARGFGIRTDTLDQQPVRPVGVLPAQNYDERHLRHDTTDRETKRGSDESLRPIRSHERDAAEDHRSRVEDSRDHKDGLSRRESISRTRDKVSSGLKGAAAALGLAPVIGLGVKEDDRRASPRRRVSDDEKEYSRAPDKSKPRERETVERKSSPREDPIVLDQRRESRRERAESVSGSKDQDFDVKRDRELERERERDRERERERERQRDRDHDYEKERGREHVREDDKDPRERQWHDGEAKLGGTHSDRREPSPDDSSSRSRRRHRPSSVFDPTDTKGLMDLKAELAALDNDKKATEPTEKSNTSASRDPPASKAVLGTNGPDQADEFPDESRGREIVPMREEKQVRVVSPPRDKSEQKPIKGILKAPSVKFPEDTNPIREGVAPHKDDPTKKDVPSGARWTKISRKKVNPEALTIGKERFEVRDDFVIVLRVLNKEEIQAYATATAQIREMRRKEYEREAKNERHSDSEQTRSDEERQRRHRHRQENEDDEHRRGRGAEDRPRRHKYDEDSESRPKTIEYQPREHHHHRHYDSNANGSDDRR